MRHIWFGAGLLAVLLAMGLWMGGTLEDTYHPCAKDLDKAAQVCWEGDWVQAEALYARAKKQWDSHRNLTAALVSHDPIGQIDRSFASLSQYAAGRDDVAFCAGCADLVQHLRAIPQPHSFTWWNLL